MDQYYNRLDSGLIWLDGYAAGSALFFQIAFFSVMACNQAVG